MATDASLADPEGVAVDPSGNYIADTANFRVRKVDASTGVITISVRFRSAFSQSRNRN